MPDAGVRLWISQAESDRHAAARMFDTGDHRTYCQVIAKHQQIVEKSVKAIAAAVRDARIAALPTSYYYDHDVTMLISALRHLPSSRDRTNIQLLIEKLLSDYWRDQIAVLSKFAPRRPPRGALHARNAEYPYELAKGDWTAPALPGAFNTHDVERFGNLAERIYQGARGIVSALRRA